MRAVIERAPLLASMGRLMGVVERRQIIPILANVCLTVSRGQVQLRGTDLDMEIIETIPANVDEPGEITVSAEKLHDIVRNADSQVTISTSAKDPRALVQSGRSRFNLPTIDPADFPTFKADGLSEPWAINASLLADMVNRVAFARGPLDPPTAFSGIYLVSTDDEIHAVACHQAGIAIRRETLPPGARVKALLVPKFTNQLVRWLGDAEGDATVSSSGNLFRVEREGVTLSGKVLDAPYFDYLRLLLEEQPLSAVTDQDALSSALKRVMIVDDAKTRTARLTVSDGGLGLSARNDASGEGADEIGCTYEGPDVQFLMNAESLQDAIFSLSGDSVEIAFAPAVDPANNNTSKTIVRNPADKGLLINLMQPRA